MFEISVWPSSFPRSAEVSAAHQRLGVCFGFQEGCWPTVGLLETGQKGGSNSSLSIENRTEMERLKISSMSKTEN